MKNLVQRLLFCMSAALLASCTSKHVPEMPENLVLPEITSHLFQQTDSAADAYLQSLGFQRTEKTWYRQGQTIGILEMQDGRVMRVYGEELFPERNQQTAQTASLWLHLLCRQLHGAPDTCSANFATWDGTIYERAEGSQYAINCLDELLMLVNKEGLAEGYVFIEGAQASPGCNLEFSFAPIGYCSTVAPVSYRLIYTSTWHD